MRLTSFPLIFAILCFIVAPSTTVAQAKNHEITQAEIAAVNYLARRFSLRFVQTKDISLVARELFVKDFIERSTKTDYSEWLILDKEFAERLPPRKLRKTYNLFTNWQYLSLLYGFSRFSSVDPADPDRCALWPPEILHILSQDQLWRASLNCNDEHTAPDSSDGLIASREQFERVFSVLSRALPLLRREAIRIRAGSTDAWRKTIEDFGGRFKYYKPWAAACERRCYGYPVGTRMFTVNAEIFQLDMVRVRGRMRIVAAWMYFD
jgi:hypothetical protein